MSGARLLALDLGTTGVRALLVGASGRVLARAWRPLDIRFPAPGRAEQDPEQMWERSLEVLREALGGGTAAALGVVTQRSTVVAWDARSGTPLAPALGWQDQRTAPRVAELRARGIPVTALASATKLEWWLREDAAVRGAVRRGTLRVGTPDAWLTWRLTGGGAHVTDPGQASCTGLYDLAAGAWSAAALELYGIGETLLPAIVGSAEPVGETPRGLLGPAIPVAARAGDQQAACFAQGAHAEGDAKLTLGTAAMLDVSTGSRPGGLDAGAFPLVLWRLAGVDAFCREGSVLSAGACVEWLVSLGLLPAAAALDRVARSVPSSGGVVFVPALQGLGTPHQDGAARGLLGGLTRGVGSAHVVRAVLEGIAHRCADLCEALGLARGAPLRVDGGLARSDLLLERLADLAARPVLRAVETETTALGAALLAGLGAGVLPDPAACVAAARRPVRFEPRAAAAERAAERRRFARAVGRARA